jgi:hypothetical protein
VPDNSTCCFSSEQYVVTTCEVSNVNIWIPILVVWAAGTFVMGAYFLRHVVDYTDVKEDPEPADSAAPEPPMEKADSLAIN